MGKKGKIWKLSRMGTFRGMSKFRLLGKFRGISKFRGIGKVSDKGKVSGERRNGKGNAKFSEHDWRHLLPELLLVIGRKVTSLADYIRFRAVCRPWRSATSLLPDHLPLQLPWLMLPCQVDGNGDSTRLFYDLSASKIHKIDLPETCGVDMCVCGSGHGWFVLQKGQSGQEMSLLNPITRATISLPSFSGLPFTIGLHPLGTSHDEFFQLLEAGNYGINATDDVYDMKAILTASPRDPSCKVFLVTFSIWPLAFCKIGDECWTVIEFEPDFPWGESDIQDMTYSNGFLYTIDTYARVTKYGINPPSRTFLGGYIDLGDNRLVEGVSGDILLIRGDWEETEHTVYKLSNDGEPEWVQVTDIGQNVLFMDNTAFSLSSANLHLPEWGANCLCYVLARKEKWRDSLYNLSIKLKLASLEDGTVTDITGDLGSFQFNEHLRGSSWLTPSLL